MKNIVAKLLIALTYAMSTVQKSERWCEKMNRKRRENTFIIKIKGVKEKL